MSSVHHAIPWAGHSNYVASKGGILMLAKTLAQELAPATVRVNAIAPGAIRTNINRIAWEAPEAMENLLRLIPSGRGGETADVAQAVLGRPSDESARAEERRVGDECAKRCRPGCCRFP